MVKRHPAAGTNPRDEQRQGSLIFSSQTLVSELLNTSPVITTLFLELHLDCIGCSMNKFCTLEELCNQYNLDFESFLEKVEERLR